MSSIGKKKIKKEVFSPREIVAFKRQGVLRWEHLRAIPKRNRFFKIHKIKQTIFYYKQKNLDHNDQVKGGRYAGQEKRCFESALHFVSTGMFQHLWTENCLDSQLFIDTLQRIHFFLNDPYKDISNKPKAFRGIHWVPWLQAAPRKLYIWGLWDIQRLEKGSFTSCRII